MTKYKTGKEIIDELNIKDFEFFNDHVKKGLQPLDKLGRPLSPTSVSEKAMRINEITHRIITLEEDMSQIEDTDIFIEKSDAREALIREINRIEKAPSLNDRDGQAPDMDWSDFNLPGSDSEAQAVIAELIRSLYNVEEIEKMGVKLGLESTQQDQGVSLPKEIDETPQAEQEEVPRRRSIRVKLRVQRVAKMLYEKYPEIDSISEMIDHPKIKECLFGERPYARKTLHRWIAEVAPERAKREGIRSKKNNTHPIS